MAQERFALTNRVASIAVRRDLASSSIQTGFGTRMLMPTTSTKSLTAIWLKGKS